MARKAVPRPASPYEILAQRIKRQILSPVAQADRRTLISRLPEESSEAWDRLMDELNEEESVQMTKLDDGAVHLTWAAPTAY
ncbi:hypothetical protein D9M68_937700 [compost metagenome]